MYYPLTEEYLTYYFSGELDRIINSFKYKLSEKYPDEVYCTLNSIDHTRIKSGNISIHSDPTGNRAAEIADLYIKRQKDLTYYQNIKEIITDIINKFDKNDIVILKASLGVKSNMTNAAKEAGISSRKAKRKSQDLISIVKTNLTKTLILKKAK